MRAAGRQASSTNKGQGPRDTPINTQAANTITTSTPLKPDDFPRVHSKVKKLPGLSQTLASTGLNDSTRSDMDATYGFMRGVGWTNVTGFDGSASASGAGEPVYPSERCDPQDAKATSEQLLAKKPLEPEGQKHTGADRPAGMLSTGGSSVLGQGLVAPRLKIPAGTEKLAAKANNTAKNRKRRQREKKRKLLADSAAADHQEKGPSGQPANGANRPKRELWSEVVQKDL